MSFNSNDSTEKVNIHVETGSTNQSVDSRNSISPNEGGISYDLFDQHCLDRFEKNIEQIGNIEKNVNDTFLFAKTDVKPKSKHWMKTYSSKKKEKINSESEPFVENCEEANVKKIATSKSELKIILPPNVKCFDTKGNLITKPPSILRAPENMLEKLTPLLPKCSVASFNGAISSDLKSKIDVKCVNKTIEKDKQHTEARLNKANLNVSVNETVKLPVSDSISLPPITKQAGLIESKSKNHNTYIKDKTDAIRLAIACAHKLNNTDFKFNSDNNLSSVENMDTKNIQEDSIPKTSNSSSDSNGQKYMKRKQRGSQSSYEMDASKTRIDEHCSVSVNKAENNKLLKSNSIRIETIESTQPMETQPENNVEKNSALEKRISTKLIPLQILTSESEKDAHEETKGSSKLCFKLVRRSTTGNSSNLLVRDKKASSQACPIFGKLIRKKEIVPQNKQFTVAPKEESSTIKTINLSNGINVAKDSMQLTQLQTDQHCRMFKRSPCVDEENSSLKISENNMYAKSMKLALLLGRGEPSVQICNKTDGSTVAKQSINSMQSEFLSEHSETIEDIQVFLNTGSSPDPAQRTQTSKLKSPTNTLHCPTKSESATTNENLVRNESKTALNPFTGHKCENETMSIFSTEHCKASEDIFKNNINSPVIHFKSTEDIFKNNINSPVISNTDLANVSCFSESLQRHSRECNCSKRQNKQDIESVLCDSVSQQDTYKAKSDKRATEESTFYSKSDDTKYISLGEISKANILTADVIHESHPDTHKSYSYFEIETLKCHPKIEKNSFNCPNVEVKDVFTSVEMEHSDRESEMTVNSTKEKLKEIFLDESWKHSKETCENKNHIRNPLSQESFEPVNIPGDTNLNCKACDDPILCILTPEDTISFQRETKACTKAENYPLASVDLQKYTPLKWIKDELGLENENQFGQATVSGKRNYTTDATVLKNQKVIEDAPASETVAEDITAPAKEPVNGDASVAEKVRGPDTETNDTTAKESDNKSVRASETKTDPVMSLAIVTVSVDTTSATETGSENNAALVTEKVFEDAKVADRTAENITQPVNIVPANEGVEETVNEYVTETDADNVTETFAEDITKVDAGYITKPLAENEFVTDLVAENVMEAANKYASETIAKNNTEPFAEDVTVPDNEDIKKADNVTESDTEDVKEPVNEHVQEPVVEGVTEPGNKFATESIVEVIIVPVQEGVMEPAYKNASETIAKAASATNTVAKNNTESFSQNVTESANEHVTVVFNEDFEKIDADNVTEPVHENVLKPAAEGVPKQVHEFVTELVNDIVIDLLAEDVMESANKNVTVTVSEDASATETVKNNTELVNEDVKALVNEDINEKDTDVTETIAEDVTESGNEHITQTDDEDVTEPVKEVVTETVSGDVTEITSEEVTVAEDVMKIVDEDLTETATVNIAEQDVTKTTAKDVMEPVDEDYSEPAAEDVTERVNKDVREADTEDFTVQVTEYDTKPVNEYDTVLDAEDFSEPVADNVTERIAEGVTELVNENVQEPVAKDVTEPVFKCDTDPVPENDTDSVSDGVAEPENVDLIKLVNEDVIEPEKGFVIESDVKDVTVPDAENVTESNAEDVKKTVYQCELPVSEYVTEPFAENVTKPNSIVVLEPIAEDVILPVNEYVTEPVAKKATKPDSMFVIDSVAEDVTLPVHEYVTEPVAENDVEPAFENYRVIVAEDVSATDPVVTETVNEDVTVVANEDGTEPLVEDVTEPFNGCVTVPVNEDDLELFNGVDTEPVNEDVTETDDAMESVNEYVAETVPMDSTDIVNKDITQSDAEGVIETTSEKDTEKVAEYGFESVVETVLQNVSDPVNQDVTKKIAQDIRETTSKEVTITVAEYVIEPVAEDFSKLVAEDVTELDAEDGKEPVNECVTEPFNEFGSEPVTLDITDNVAECVIEPVNEDVTEKVAKDVKYNIGEDVTEPVNEYVTESNAEDVKEPFNERVTEPVAEGFTKPVNDYDTELVAEYVAEKFAECVTVPVAEDTSAIETNATNLIEPANKNATETVAVESSSLETAAKNDGTPEIINEDVIDLATEGNVEDLSSAIVSNNDTTETVNEDVISQRFEVNKDNLYEPKIIDSCITVNNMPVKVLKRKLCPKSKKYVSPFKKLEAPSTADNARNDILVNDANQKLLPEYSIFKPTDTTDKSNSFASLDKCANTIYKSPLEMDKLDYSHPSEESAEDLKTCKIGFLPDNQDLKVCLNDSNTHQTSVAMPKTENITESIRARETKAIDDDMTVTEINAFNNDILALVTKTETITNTPIIETKMITDKATVSEAITDDMTAPETEIETTSDTKAPITETITDKIASLTETDTIASLTETDTTAPINETITDETAPTFESITDIIAPIAEAEKITNTSPITEIITDTIGPLTDTERITDNTRAPETETITDTKGPIIETETITDTKGPITEIETITDTTATITETERIKDNTRAPLTETETITDNITAPLTETERITDNTRAPETETITDATAPITETERYTVNTKAPLTETETITDATAPLTETETITDATAPLTETETITNTTATITETETITDNTRAPETETITDTIATITETITDATAHLTETETITDTTATITETERITDNTRAPLTETITYTTATITETERITDNTTATEAMKDDMRALVTETDRITDNTTATEAMKDDMRALVTETDRITDNTTATEAMKDDMRALVTETITDNTTATEAMKDDMRALVTETISDTTLTKAITDDMVPSVSEIIVDDTKTSVSETFAGVTTVPLNEQKFSIFAFEECFVDLGTPIDHHSLSGDIVRQLVLESMSISEKYAARQVATSWVKNEFDESDYENSNDGDDGEYIPDEFEENEEPEEKLGYFSAISLRNNKRVYKYVDCSVNSGSSDDEDDNYSFGSDSIEIDVTTENENQAFEDRHMKSVRVNLDSIDHLMCGQNSIKVNDLISKQLDRKSKDLENFSEEKEHKAPLKMTISKSVLLGPQNDSKKMEEIGVSESVRKKSHIILLPNEVKDTQDARNKEIGDLLNLTKTVPKKKMCPKSKQSVLKNAKQNVMSPHVASSSESNVEISHENNIILNDKKQSQDNYMKNLHGTKAQKNEGIITVANSKLNNQKVSVTPLYRNQTYASPLKNTIRGITIASAKRPAIEIIPIRKVPKPELIFKESSVRPKGSKVTVLEFTSKGALPSTLRHKEFAEKKNNYENEFFKFAKKSPLQKFKKPVNIEEKIVSKMIRDYPKDQRGSLKKLNNIEPSNNKTSHVIKEEKTLATGEQKKVDVKIENSPQEKITSLLDFIKREKTKKEKQTSSHGINYFKPDNSAVNIPEVNKKRVTTEYLDSAKSAFVIDTHSSTNIKHPAHSSSEFVSTKEHASDMISTNSHADQSQDPCKNIMCKFLDSSTTSIAQNLNNSLTTQYRGDISNLAVKSIDSDQSLSVIDPTLDLNVNGPLLTENLPTLADAVIDELLSNAVLSYNTTLAGPNASGHQFTSRQDSVSNIHLPPSISSFPSPNADSRVSISQRTFLPNQNFTHRVQPLHHVPCDSLTSRGPLSTQPLEETQNLRRVQRKSSSSSNDPPLAEQLNAPPSNYNVTLLPSTCIPNPMCFVPTAVCNPVTLNTIPTSNSSLALESNFVSDSSHFNVIPTRTISTGLALSSTPNFTPVSSTVPLTPVSVGNISLVNSSKPIQSVFKPMEPGQSVSIPRHSIQYLVLNTTNPISAPPITDVPQSITSTHSKRNYETSYIPIEPKISAEPFDTRICAPSKQKTTWKLQNRKSPVKNKSPASYDTYDEVINAVASNPDKYLLPFENSTTKSNAEIQIPHLSPLQSQITPTPLPPIQSLNSHIPIIQDVNSCLSLDNSSVYQNNFSNSTPSYSYDFSYSTQPEEDPIINSNYADSDFHSLPDWVLDEYLTLPKVTTESNAVASSIDTISSQLEASCNQQNFLLNTTSASESVETLADKSPMPSYHAAASNETPPNSGFAALDKAARLHRVFEVLDVKSKANIIWNESGLLKVRPLLRSACSKKKRKQYKPFVNENNTETGDIPSTSQYLDTHITSQYLDTPSSSQYLGTSSASQYLNTLSTSQQYLDTPSTSQYLGTPSTSQYLNTPNTSQYPNTPSTSQYLDTPNISQYPNSSTAQYQQNVLLATASTCQNQVVKQKSTVEGNKQGVEQSKPTMEDVTLEDKIEEGPGKQITPLIQKEKILSTVQTVEQRSKSDSDDKAKPVLIISNNLAKELKQVDKHLANPGNDISLVEPTKKNEPSIKNMTANTETSTENVENYGPFNVECVNQNDVKTIITTASEASSSTHLEINDENKHKDTVANANPSVELNTELSHDVNTKTSPTEPKPKAQLSEFISSKTIEIKSCDKASTSTDIKPRPQLTINIIPWGGTHKNVSILKNIKTNCSEQEVKNINNKKRSLENDQDLESIIAQQLKTVKKICSDHMNIVKPVEVSSNKPFATGDYLVRNPDLFKPNPPLWKVDIEQKKIDEYTYLNVGEESDNKFTFVFQKQSSIGHFLSEDTKLWIKLHFSEEKGGIRFDQAENERALQKFVITRSYNGSANFKSVFFAYTQVIISQALNPNFISEIKLNHKGSPSHVAWMKVNQILCRYMKTMVRCFVHYNESTVKALLVYPFCKIKNVNPNQVAQSREQNYSCPLCQSSVCNVLMILRGPSYERDTLVPDDNVNDKIIIRMCSECSDLCVLLSKVAHFNHWVFQAAKDIVDKQFPSSQSSASDSSTVEDSAQTPLRNSILYDTVFYSRLFGYFQSTLSHIDHCEYFILSGPYIFRRRLKRVPDDFTVEVTYEEERKNKKEDATAEVKVEMVDDSESEMKIETVESDKKNVEMGDDIDTVKRDEKKIEIKEEMKTIQKNGIKYAVKNESIEKYETNENTEISGSVSDEIEKIKKDEKKNERVENVNTVKNNEKKIMMSDKVKKSKMNEHKIVCTMGNKLEMRKFENKYLGHMKGDTMNIHEKRNEMVDVRKNKKHGVKDIGLKYKTDSEKQNVKDIKEQIVTENEEQKMTINERQKATENEEQKVTENEEQKATENEEQRATENEEPRATENEEQRVTDNEEQRVTENEEQKATENEEQRATENKEQRATENEEQRVTNNEEQRATDNEEQRATENEGQNTTVGKDFDLEAEIVKHEIKIKTPVTTNRKADQFHQSFADFILKRKSEVPGLLEKKFPSTYRNSDKDAGKLSKSKK